MEERRAVVAPINGQVTLCNRYNRVGSIFGILSSSSKLVSVVEDISCSE